MTERGLPIVDGASACPFVAFEDERDERSIRPDHRHRCYAEVRPAPRALAHQEAYCLAPAFPACPTFQDWARREAARARPGTALGDELGEGAVGPGRRLDRSRSPDERGSGQSGQSGRRDWASSPPWATGPGVGFGDDLTGRSASRSGAGSEASLTNRPSERSGTGSEAGQGTPLPPEARGLADAPAFLAARERAGAGATGGSGEFRRPGPPGGAAGKAQGKAQGKVPDDAPDEVRDEDEDGDVPPGSGPGWPRRPAGGRPSAADGYSGERSLRGPSWERPQRFEAYPTLKTRVGMPDVPRVAVGFAALIIAAIALFFIPPLLIQPSGNTGAGLTPTPTGSAESSPSLAPTPIPSPTPQTYAIAAGDTLSKVAKRFGITLADLLAANPSIKNPDKISIGQEIVIPVPAPSVVVDPGTSDGGSPAPSSAAP